MPPAIYTHPLNNAMARVKKEASTKRREAQAISRDLASPDNLRRLFIYWNTRGKGLEAWEKRRGRKRGRWGCGGAGRPPRRPPGRPRAQAHPPAPKEKASGIRSRGLGLIRRASAVRRTYPFPYPQSPETRYPTPVIRHPRPLSTPDTRVHCQTPVPRHPGSGALCLEALAIDSVPLALAK